MKVGVVVIGAGPAGVTAARELKEKGISAVVVEAQGRIGGRILNTHDPTNTPEIRNFSKFPRENPPTSPQHTLQEFQTREGPTTSSCLVVQVTGAVPWSSRPPRPLLCFHRTRSARSRRDDPVKERAMKEGIFGPRASLERGPPVHPIGPESVSCSSFWPGSPGVPQPWNIIPMAICHRVLPLSSHLFMIYIYLTNTQSIYICT